MPQLLAPAYPVAPPSYLPPLHGLLASAVPVPDEPGSRWLLGIAVEPEGWEQATAIPGTWCGADYQAVAGLKPAEAPPAIYYYHPFQLVTSYSCKVGRTGEERRDKVRRFLDLATGKAVEHELWTGAVSDLSDTDNMRLAIAGTGAGGSLTAADLAVVVNPGFVPAAGIATAAPVSIEGGIQLLSQALADYGPGSKGMIHCTAAAGEAAAQSNALTEDGRGGNGILRTRSRGDVVVVGSGYPGTGPGGTVPPDGFTWIHATSMVQVRLTDIVLLPETDAEAVNRRTNEWTVRAERAAAAYFDGVVVGSCLVNLTLEDEGSWT
jgi:hypothetical protein